MALIKGQSVVLSEDVKKRIEILPNFDLSDKQKDSGLLAKVQVRYCDNITFIVNVWKGTGTRPYLTTPSQRGTSRSFVLVALEREIAQYILQYVLAEMKNPSEASAWYKSFLGEQVTSITTEEENDFLGITGITVDTNLTHDQVLAGIMGKVSVMTHIGVFHSYTVFKSKFGKSLYGTVPAENGTRENGQRGVPAYNFSRLVQAQILNYIDEQLVDWDAEQEVPAKVERRNTAVETATGETSGAETGDAGGFQPTELGDDIVFDGDTAGESQPAEGTEVVAGAQA